jgi:hypothetical protein
MGKIISFPLNLYLDPLSPTIYHSHAICLSILS